MYAPRRFYSCSALRPSDSTEQKPYAHFSLSFPLFSVQYLSSPALSSFLFLCARPHRILQEIQMLKHILSSARRWEAVRSSASQGTDGAKTVKVFGVGRSMLVDAASGKASDAGAAPDLVLSTVCRQRMHLQMSPRPAKICARCPAGCPERHN